MMDETTQTVTSTSATDMSPTIGKLAGALAKAQGMMHGAIKDSSNPFFKSNYADLGSVWEAIREPLSKHGISVIQTTEPDDKGVTIVTTIAHESGEWMRGRIRMIPTKNDPQGLGSAMTYARRYALAAIAGIAQVDDDGNAATIQRVGTTPVDSKKVAAAVKAAIEIIESDDEDNGPQLARDLIKSLHQDEQIALKAELEKFKGGTSGKKSYYSMLKEYYDMKATAA